jgi:hypothetical protein
MEDYSTRPRRQNTGLSAMISSASRLEQLGIATRYSGGARKVGGLFESPPWGIKITVVRKRQP